jgi:excisionase family DNA binding protein
MTTHAEFTVTTLSEPETLTVEEAGRVLGIGRNAAYEACARGDIPSIRIGKRILVPRRQLLELLTTPSMREPDLGRAQSSRDERDDGQGTAAR